MRRVVLLSAVTLVVMVVAFVVVLPPLFFPPKHTSTSTSQETGASKNVRLDVYTSGNWTGANGDEPYATASANGTIYAAWIGVRQIHPTVYLNSSTSFDSEIWFARSTDNGKSFSEPILVSANTAGVDYFDPSIAVSGRGNVYLTYVSTSTTTGQGNLYLAVGTAHPDHFQNILVPLDTHYPDRPWVAVNGTGAIFIVYDDLLDPVAYAPGTYWVYSADNGTVFSSPMLLQIRAFPTGLLIGADGAVYVTAIDENAAFPSIPLPVTTYVGVKPPGSATFVVSTQEEIQLAYPFGYSGEKIQWPGPTIAVDGNEILLAYVTNDGRTLELQNSNDSGQTWSKPSALIAYNSSMIQKPWMAVNPEGNTLAVVWQGNQTGFWNTYLSTCSIPCSSPSAPIRVSDHNGYPSDVLNWHGDFQGAFFITNDQVAVIWGDGYGLPNFYGNGHVYFSTVVPS